MARPPRAVFVTLATVLTLGGVAGGAQAVPDSSRNGTSGRGGLAAPAVLPAAKPAGVAPTAAGVRRALAPVLRDPSLGRHNGAYVYDASRGRPIVALGATTPFVPASTLKLLTIAGALATMGPDQRFITKTVSASNGSLVLVGGGDPLLTAKRPTDPTAFPARATLQDLAASTAKSLRAQGVTSITLGYDATLFSGPAINPKWEQKYVPEGIAAPTSALWVNEGRVQPGMAKRSPSPALAAATTFAGLLRTAGIKVAPAIKPATAGAAAEVAQVRSATLGELVEYVNLHSDNDGAEVLLRHVGVATKNGGSIAGGLTGLRATLTKLGLNLGKSRIEDGSGLSRTNQVPLDLLAGVVRVAVAKPELRHLLTGLPVAGFNGSLENRFAGPGAGAGMGLVRAKTGTLTGVHSLAGMVRDRTGTLLVFAVATDSNPPDKALAARAALDRASAVLATCGCAS